MHALHSRNNQNVWLRGTVVYSVVHGTFKEKERFRSPVDGQHGCQ
jgi:hypothetical protein